MITKPHFPALFKPLLLAAALASTSIAHSAEAVDNNIVKNPWAVDLTIYAWMPSVIRYYDARPFYWIDRLLVNTE